MLKSNLNYKHPGQSMEVNAVTVFHKDFLSSLPKLLNI